MDIVERARADVLRSGTWADTGNLILEMADEIEKLRTSCGHCGELEQAFERAERAELALAAAIRNRSEP
jgi:hypothetical protein